MTLIEMLLRLGLGVGCGALIGIERQFRARMAGLRTNALVSTGATLFVVLSAQGFTGETADPTRVAAQIVSGIGFLGGGVILREGLTVRGLNTAATLWCSAAVGSLAGAGLHLMAVVGSLTIVTIHLVLRPVGRALDRHPTSSDEAPVAYTFLAVTRDDDEARVRNLLVQSLSRTDFALQSVESTNAHSDGLVEVRAALSAEHRDDKQMESAVSRLSLEPSVSSVRWQVHTYGPDDEEDQ
ncbi:MgtC/SapB family protein [Pseudonocardia sp. ICBG162]|uniref:MgtC/SapB family protein n=1 Tax=Pseudonocardia sp. ICBG162 TaxID=2846761 RepID=UPI001CF6966C|nr:MgtC/SapB family protein [Pseudonocardia sp. ICBG162]